MDEIAVSDLQESFCSSAKIRNHIVIVDFRCCVSGQTDCNGSDSFFVSILVPSVDGEFHIQLVKIWVCVGERPLLETKGRFPDIWHEDNRPIINLNIISIYNFKTVFNGVSVSVFIVFGIIYAIVG